MRNIFKLLSCVVALLALAGVSQAKAWRGIVPLHSTREDVVRLLGQCSDPHPGCGFSIVTEDVRIVFSSNHEYAPDCEKRLPPGVVLQIEITPKTDVRLSDLYADPGKLKETVGYTRPGSAYVDEEEGVVYHASDGKVVQMVYIAARKDRPLCPGYYEDPARFVTNVIEDPPVIEVDCPETVEAGEWVTLTANVIGADPNVTPAFSWKLTAGKIVSGQGTSSIKINPGIFEGRTIKATVKVVGYVIDLEDSCEIRVIKRGKGGK
jgi:hypothetical protein